MDFLTAHITIATEEAGGRFRQDNLAYYTRLAAYQWQAAFYWHVARMWRIERERFWEVQ